MAILSTFNTDDKSFQLMQSQWQSILNPVIANPLVSGRVLGAVVLKSGTNVINHLLGQKLQGWFLTDRTQYANIYRTADKDALTLTLFSSAPVTVDIYVF